MRSASRASGRCPAQRCYGRSSAFGFAILQRFAVVFVRSYKRPSRVIELPKLGQSFRVEHWLRLRSRIDLEDTLSLVLEGDVPRGYVAGDERRSGQVSRFIHSLSPEATENR